MKKILIFIGGYFPGENYGGPPVSVNNFCTLFLEQFSVYIVTRNHDNGSFVKYDVDDCWVKRDNCIVKYISDDEWKKKTITKIINEIRPHIIYLQSFFSSFIPICLAVAKKENIPVLLAPRGELCEGALNIKRYKKIPYIYLLKIFRLTTQVSFQATSKDERLAIREQFRNNSIFDLENIPSIPERFYEFTKKEKGGARFVFISRISCKKNLSAAISFFQNITFGKVLFDIYGVIEDTKYWEKCQDIIRVIPDNITVTYKGIIPHSEVYRVLSNYDALLLPTMSENYGHIIAEALGVGCPVIISDQTPWNDVNLYKAGAAIALRDNEKFICFLNKIILMGDDEIKIYRNNARRLFKDKNDINNLKKSYETVFDSICNMTDN